MSGVVTVNAKIGTLRLDEGRLRFRETGANAATFDLAVGDIRNVRFPVYNVGTVVRFDSGGERYRLAFLAAERRFKWSGARFRDVRPARRRGKQWKSALARIDESS